MSTLAEIEAGVRSGVVAPNHKKYLHRLKIQSAIEILREPGAVEWVAAELQSFRGALEQWLYEGRATAPGLLVDVVDRFWVDGVVIGLRHRPDPAIQQSVRQARVARAAIWAAHLISRAEWNYGRHWSWWMPQAERWLNQL